jgi:hypothetical protein
MGRKTREGAVERCVLRAANLQDTQPASWQSDGDTAGKASKEWAGWASCFYFSGLFSVGEIESGSLCCLDCCLFPLSPISRPKYQSSTWQSQVLLRGGLFFISVGSRAIYSYFILLSSLRCPLLDKGFLIAPTFLSEQNRKKCVHFFEFVCLPLNVVVKLPEEGEGVNKIHLCFPSQAGLLVAVFSVSSGMPQEVCDSYVRVAASQLVSQSAPERRIGLHQGGEDCPEGWQVG